MLADIDYGIDFNENDKDYNTKIKISYINNNHFKDNKFKKIIKCGLSFTLLGFFIYTSASTINLLNGLDYKPIAFATDKYEKIKVMETKYSKDAIDINEYYDNSKTNNILTIKSPYDILDDSFCRQVYKFDDNYLSDSERNFIKSNIHNQNKLLDQDFIQKYISSTKKLKTSKVEYAEYTDEDFIYSDDNNYEIEYTSFTNDKNDVKMQEIGDNCANFINMTNGVLSTIYLALFTPPIINSIKSDSKKKIKKDNRK